jgi:NAD(P)-dependent dehydrogenase (short-subunit alcohol dehydrogenase family)
MSTAASPGTGVFGRTVLVIGASGGIGSAVATALLEAGASEVIAASRNPIAATGSRFNAVELDVRVPSSISRVAEVVGQRVDMVICVSGVNSNRRLTDYEETAAREEMETNYFGLLNVFRAFSPLLKAKGYGSFVNILSVLSHVNHPMMATYCASKAAAFSLTQAMRAELKPHGVSVVAVMPPVVDTQMSRHVPQPKLSPRALARLLIEGLDAGAEDIYPGAAAALRDALQQDSKNVERVFAARLPVQ